MDVGLVCDLCSTFNPIGTSKCSRCGDLLSLDRDTRSGTPPPHEETIAGVGEALPATVPCPKCGSDVIAGRRFCGQCGTPMLMAPGSVAPPVPAAIKPPSGKLMPAGPRDRGIPAPISPSQTTKPHPSRQSGPMASAQASGRTPAPQLRSARQTQFFGAIQEGRAKLVLIKGGGQTGISFTLAGEEHLAGRSNTPILFEEDPFLSPVHANFFYRQDTLLVRDESSTNGVYIRIQGTVPIYFGDRFLVGEQVLEVQAMPDNQVLEATADGTYFFASPRRTSYFRVVQMLLGGQSGLAYRAYSPDVVIGREANDIDFPEDPFISGRHARLSLKNNQLTLTDLDSKNGTFLRIRGEHPLKHGDYVFMGQQLLRVEIV